MTQNIHRVLMRLKKQFPNPGAMEVGNPYQNLVAVILSARTRDEQVLKLLPAFFKRFQTVQDLAAAEPREIEKWINTIGMYRQKAKHLHKMANDVVYRFHGSIPETMWELVSLAGVGRKTASVVLVASFGKPAIAVDTHVHRVTNRIGWVHTKTPAQTEAALLKIVPKRSYRMVNRVFVKLGRYICLPGRPRCFACPVRDRCAYAHKQLTVPKNADVILLDIERRENELERLRRRATV